MSYKFNPWLAFLLGVIVGWLLIWLPARWWARRRQRAGQERLMAPEIELPVAGWQPSGAAQVPAVGEVSATEALPPAPEVQAVEATAPMAEGVSSSLEGEAPTGEAPAAEVEVPVGAAAMPSLEFQAPAVEVETPADEASAPAAEVSALQPEQAVPAGAAAPADDLIQIWGIGPRFAAQLAAAGITTFAALAQLDEARLAEIIAAPAWRKANYGEWIAQASLAAAGDEVGFKALVEELSRRRAEKI
jgi:predicted flap endonuclease-1-like 5' DNA nuclease